MNYYKVQETIQDVSGKSGESSETSQTSQPNETIEPGETHEHCETSYIFTDNDSCDAVCQQAD